MSQLHFAQLHFDYEALIFMALIVTLISWGLYQFQKRKTKKLNKWGRVSRNVASYLPIILVVFSLRSFAFEPFRIPSSSMMPTLYTGDFILVDKFSYGLKMPVFHNTLIKTGSPERGDVFVFRSVEDPSIDIIKRVVALPGDHVKYDARDKMVYINGKALSQTEAKAYQGFLDDISPTGLLEKTETIDGESHQMLTANGINYPFQFTEMVVPQGHYFGMGDNRDYSADSRVFGLIPEENIVGKARMVWMHWRPSAFVEGLKRVGTLL